MTDSPTDAQVLAHRNPGRRGGHGRPAEARSCRAGGDAVVDPTQGRFPGAGSEKLGNVTAVEQPAQLEGDYLDGFIASGWSAFEDQIDLPLAGSPRSSHAEIGVGAGTVVD